jgi:hypothetical protein
MSQTKRIPREQLRAYFDEFTKRFLRDASPEAVGIEVLDPERGDEVVTVGAPLVGITYEPGANVLEIEMESGDHRDISPAEVWVIEEPNGFVNSFEVVRADGSREVISVRRAASRRIE